MQERPNSSLSTFSNAMDHDLSLRSTSSLSSTAPSCASKCATWSRPRSTSPSTPNGLANLTASFSQESLASLRSSQSRRRRLPNVLQPPRWERGEDAPWNPPTYLQQSRPGSQSHILLESLPVRTRAAARRRWRTSATPLVATALC